MTNTKHQINPKDFVVLKEVPDTKQELYSTKIKKVTKINMDQTHYTLTRKLYHSARD
jgi:hypothetical protein